MSKVKLTIRLEWSFFNEFYIGGGKGSGIIDCYVLKDCDNKPYIPGSSIKGRTKYNFQLLLNMVRESEINAQYPTDIVSKWFGTEGNCQGKLYFDDLKLTKASSSYENDYSVRSGVQISRYTGKAKDKALFSIETAGLGGKHRLVGEVNGYVEKKEFDEYAPILYTAITMIKTLGGGQSRGLGWLDDSCSTVLYEDGMQIGREALERWGETFEI